MRHFSPNEVAILLPYCTQTQDSRKIDGIVYSNDIMSYRLRSYIL